MRHNYPFLYISQIPARRRGRGGWVATFSFSIFTKLLFLRITMVDPCCNMITQHFWITFPLAKVLIEKLACNSGFNGKLKHLDATVIEISPEKDYSWQGMCYNTLVDLWTCHDPKGYKLNFQSSSSGSIMYIHLKPAAPERTNQYYESINFQEIHPLLNLLWKSCKGLKVESLPKMDPTSNGFPGISPNCGRLPQNYTQEPFFKWYEHLCSLSNSW